MSRPADPPSQRAPALPPPLLGLFQALLARDVALSQRDYLDGLRALQAGFGQQGSAGLRRLARALWARSDEERRLVDNWFDQISTAPAAVLAQVDAAIDQVIGKPAAALAGSAPAAALASAVLPGQAPATSALPTGANKATGAPADARARVSFAAADGGAGLLLPRLLAAPDIAEDYVLHPQPLLRQRDLAVLWRRYRRATRMGPRTDLDVAATVQQCCRSGLLQAPVYRPRRRNSARLLVLADVSPSMAPWLPLLDTLAESLALGRLAQVAMRYFNNLPRHGLFDSPALDTSETLDDLLRRFAGAGLLVISDGGSARGFLNRRRASATRLFLDQVAGPIRPIVWLNPMPRARWAGTTAGLLADDPRTNMLPLDAAHLLRAVDRLRGLR